MASTDKISFGNGSADIPTKSIIFTSTNNNWKIYSYSKLIHDDFLILHEHIMNIQPIEMNCSNFTIQPTDIIGKSNPIFLENKLQYFNIPDIDSSAQCLMIEYLPFAHLNNDITMTIGKNGPNGIMYDFELFSNQSSDGGLVLSYDFAIYNYSGSTYNTTIPRYGIDGFLNRIVPLVKY